MTVQSENYEDYILENRWGNKELRHYSFVLKNTEYSEMKVATTLRLNASTNLNLWLGESGNVIGLDFIQVKEEKTSAEKIIKVMKEKKVLG